MRYNIDMQFQVPQFIEAEDKIVGPLSLRQFIYVCIAGGVSIMLYFSVGGFIWLFGTIIVLGLAIGFAFVKIGGRPLADVMFAAASFYWKPQIYVWQPEHPVVKIQKAREIMPSPAAPAAAPEEVRRKVASGSGLHQIFAVLQTGERGKQSDKQFLERQMESRYQIFRRETGDRNAAKRVDYR